MIKFQSHVETDSLLSLDFPNLTFYQKTKFCIDQSQQKTKFSASKYFWVSTLNTGSKLNVCKTFRRCTWHLLKILSTFNSCPFSRGVYLSKTIEPNKQLLIRYRGWRQTPLDAVNENALKKPINIKDFCIFRIVQRHAQKKRNLMEILRKWKKRLFSSFCTEKRTTVIFVSPFFDLVCPNFGEKCKKQYTTFLRTPVPLPSCKK